MVCWLYDICDKRERLLEDETDENQKITSVALQLHLRKNYDVMQNVPIKKWERKDHHDEDPVIRQRKKIRRSL